MLYHIQYNNMQHSCDTKSNVNKYSYFEGVQFIVGIQHENIWSHERFMEYPLL